uniref:Uncharacterized protein n=1 Tax=Anguilla anguilla TaxID=7936 RepID=A0A0E9RPS9_ANGAN
MTYRIKTLRCTTNMIVELVCNHGY